MLTAVYVLVAALMVVGLAGAALPILPGTPLILLGAVIYAFATDWQPIGLGRLAILAALAALSSVAGYLGTAVGARGGGGSRWAVLGAIAGGLVGLAFAPVGLLVGPLVGAIAAEFVRSGQLRASLRTGVGATVGVIAGAVLHGTLALVMVALFLWWLWRG